MINKTAPVIIICTLMLVFIPTNKSEYVNPNETNIIIDSIQKVRIDKPDVLLVDIDNDSDLDVFHYCYVYSNTYNGFISIISIISNNGNNSYQLVNEIEFHSNYYISLINHNGDELPDLLMINLTNILVIDNEGGDTFFNLDNIIVNISLPNDINLLPPLIKDMKLPPLIKDMNSDGFDDIILVTYDGKNSIYYYENGTYSALNFIGMSCDNFLDVYICDINNDDYLDLIYYGRIYHGGSGSEPEIFVEFQLNDKKGYFSKSSSKKFESGSFIYCIDDVDNNSKLDIIQKLDRNLNIFFQSDNLTFTKRTYSHIDNFSEILFMDVNYDQIKDIIYINNEKYNQSFVINIALGDEDFSYDYVRKYVVSSNAYKIKCKDMNNDGISDLLCLGYRSITVLVNNGDGTFAEDSDNDSYCDDTDAFPKDPAAAIDNDIDGYPDSWNPGMGPEDSTTGLTLDPYPDDPDNIPPDNDGNETPANGKSKTRIWASGIAAVVIVVAVAVVLLFHKKKEPPEDQDDHGGVEAKPNEERNK